MKVGELVWIEMNIIGKANTIFVSTKWEMDSKDLDTVNIIVREELPANDNYGAFTDNHINIDVDKHQSLFGNKFPKDREYAEIVFDAENAILSGDKPVLSSKGTSGCYFVNGCLGVCKFIFQFHCWYVSACIWFHNHIDIA